MYYVVHYLISIFKCKRVINENEDGYLHFIFK